MPLPAPVPRLEAPAECVDDGGGGQNEAGDGQRDPGIIRKPLLSYVRLHI